MRSALWVTQVYPRFGGDVMGGFLHRLAKELPARGWDVQVVAPGADGAPDRDMLDGVAVERFRYAPPGRANLAYTGEMHRAALRNPLRFAAFLRRFRAAAARAAREARAEVVHAHWWMPSGWAARAAAPQGTPFVISVHGTDVRLVDRFAAARPLARTVLGRADRVLAVSSHLAERVRALGIERCDVLPMPADGDVFRPGGAAARDAAGGDAGATRFVVAARLTAQKRVDLAIGAVAELARRGVDARLDVAGDGPERERLETTARGLDVAAKVRFHGMVDPSRLAELYRGAAACILCSEGEGYGLTVVEAALCGTPSVGTRSGGLPDVIDDGVTGLLAPAGDRSALAAAMARLAEDAAERARMGAAARAKAEAVTAAPIADRLAALYAELCAAQGRQG